MEPNNHNLNPMLPQVQEILELLQKAREWSVQSLQRVETLNSYATQIQGRNTFIQKTLQEQAQVMGILSEQNPELEILKSSKDRLDEALSHSLALSNISQRSLEILDLSANDVSEDGLLRASGLLRSVIACLELLEKEKIEAFVCTMQNNQNATSTQDHQESLQILKNHIKG